MKTMTSRTVLLILLAVFISTSCKHEHKHSHKVFSIPYNKNQKFFKNICRSNLANNNCWQNLFCPIDSSDAAYVEFHWDRSTKNEILRNKLDSFMYVPFYSESTATLVKARNPEGDIEVGGNSISIPFKGSFGCCYFLAGEATTGSSFVGAKRGCHLDYFDYGTRKYLNLVFIYHSDELTNDNLRFATFRNLDFPVSAADYSRLDSLLKVEKNVAGGIDITNKQLLKVYKGEGDPVFTITADTTIIFHRLEHVKPRLLFN